MTWAPGPVVTRRRLGGELKRLREQAGKKLEDVAKVLECSPSKISRLENGKGLPRSRDVRDMLDVYGIGEGETRTRLLEWSRTGQQPMWWSDYSDVLAPDTATYVELEWDAARIHAYESHIVHGLLQTRDYARAVIETYFADTRLPADLDRLVEVRMRRQEALTADHGLTLTCVLDESALYRVVGSPEILRGQIQHLVGMAGAEHVDVRVLPFSAGLAAANLAPFAKLEFTDGIEQGLVYLERPGLSELLSAPEEVALHTARMQALLGVALTERQSVPLMERAFEGILAR